MNYDKIYNQIVQAAKLRINEGYTEKHHILPRCMGGTNDSSNLVSLTAKEHYICHRLLCEIYPKNRKLLYALSAMMIPSNGRYKSYNISSRLYAHIKKELFQTRSIYLKQFNPMKNINLRAKRSIEMKANNLFHRLTTEQKQKHRQNVSVAKMGCKNPRAKKCIWVATERVFGSCNDLLRDLNLSRSKQYYFDHGHIKWLT